MSRDTIQANSLIACHLTAKRALSTDIRQHATAPVLRWVHYSMVFTNIGNINYIIIMQVRTDNRKVVNLFQFKCDTCMENARSRYR